MQELNMMEVDEVGGSATTPYDVGTYVGMKISDAVKAFDSFNKWLDNNTRVIPTNPNWVS